MTLREAAQTAIDIQDACNLSGVLRTFDSVVSDVIWPEARRLGQGTDYVNRHPIVRVFLAKLADLNGLEYSWSAEAFTEVESIASEAHSQDLLFGGHKK
jgi:hypothetical protein